MNTCLGPGLILWYDLSNGKGTEIGYLNVKKIRREASKHFRNNQKEYLKPKIDLTETNSKIKNIRDLYMDISELKKG
jgi:hypothetical protein